MTPDSPLQAPKDQPFDIVVLSTAALPWRTGPSIFSVWHAGGFAKLGHKTALGLPWLDRKSQTKLWGKELFKTRQEQADWVRKEAEHMNVPALPEIFFFRGVFSKSTYSIFITEDPFKAGPQAKYYVVQEPEHFGWLPVVSPRKDLKADKILGIVMTNYGFYIRRPGRPDRALFAKLVEWRNKQLMRKHTDVIAPLSPAVDLDDLNHPVVRQQVTGVLDSFKTVSPVSEANKGIYFMGRLVWEKALDVVIDTARDLDLAIDIFGEGPHQIEMQERAHRTNAPVHFKGPAYSPWETLADYRVFFNPSLSEVLCSTTAEALVAGRHVVIPDCPANTPFYDLPNVHVYRTVQEIPAAMNKALSTLPLSPSKARERFDWANVCSSIVDLLQSPDAAPISQKAPL